MAKNNKINEEVDQTLSSIKHSSTQAKELKATILSIGESIKQAIDDAIHGTEALTDKAKHLDETFERDIVNSLAKVTRGMSKQLDIQTKIAKGENTSKQIRESILRNEQTREVIKKRLAAAEKHGLNIDKEGIKNQFKRIDLENELLKDLLDQNNELSNQKGIITALRDRMANYADKIDESGTLSGILKGNYEDIFTTANLIEVGSAAIVNTLITGILELDKLQTQYANTFALTKGEAAEVLSYVSEIANESGRTSITYRTIHEAIAGIAETAGILASTLRKDVLEEAAELHKLVGLSNEGMTNLALNAQTTGQHMEDQSLEMMRGLSAAEDMMGVTLNVKEAFQAAAETTGLIRANIGRSYGEIIKVVGKAQALGLTLQDLANISSNLLDFQSSIEAELTAELFTGKQLYLEKARLYALTGDYSKLQDEIVGQLGSEYEFLKMNTLQKQKFAAALGMSADQLSDVIMQEENLDSIRQQAEARGDKEMLKELKRRDLQQQMADLIEKIQTSFIALAQGPLGTIANMMSTILESAGLFYTILGLVAAVKIGGLIAQFYALAAAKTAGATASMWNLGLTTVGVGLAIAIPLIVAGLAGMFKTQKEQTRNVKTMSFAGLEPNKMVTLESGEATFHQGETLFREENFKTMTDKQDETNSLLKNLKLAFTVETHHATRYR